ncbi:hypothetical protein FOZ60_007294 [Perkinsus olseni]|uniref:Cytochrome P450 n=1 Tax=Perkinsus olseni TaxID=32597 RepID=A0A7J6NLX1_PEROL|nr:hypothetical protein FOZ60_007294 [Perkinsus olseni]
MTAVAAGFIGFKVLKFVKRILERTPFPGPGISFMLRLALMSPEDQFKKFLEMPKMFGKICCFKSPTRQVLVVSDMPTYRSVMKRRPREFSKPDYENIMDGVQMAVSEGDMWKKHRRISSRPLTETNVNKLLPMITDTTQKMIEKLEGSADEKGNVLWRPVEDLRLCASRIASAVCMGEEDPTASGDPLYGNEMQDELWGLIRDAFVVSMKPTRVFYHDRFLYKLIFPGVRQFAKRFKSIESKAIDGFRARAAVDPERPRLCKGLKESAGNEYSEKELAHTLIMYLGGGGETTASAVAWMLHAFCTYPEVQQRARAEADSIGEITPTSIHSIPYIEACALEALRLNPSVPISINKALVDTEVAGKTVKAGTQLIFLVGQMMRENYDEGDKFMPERWLSTDGASIDVEKRSEFIAFGFGPRQCPGRFLGIAEIICSAALFLRNFNEFRHAKGQEGSSMFTTPLTTLPQNLVVTMRCRCNIGA